MRSLACRCCWERSLWGRVDRWLYLGVSAGWLGHLRKICRVSVGPGGGGGGGGDETCPGSCGGVLFGLWVRVDLVGVLCGSMVHWLGSMGWRFPGSWHLVPLVSSCSWGSLCQSCHVRWTCSLRSSWSGRRCIGVRSGGLRRPRRCPFPPCSLLRSVPISGI